MRTAAAAGIPGSGLAAIADGVLDQQIGRLTGVVEQAESLIAAMTTALKHVESNGVPRRRVMAVPSKNVENNEVLREIFESNLGLRRGMAGGATRAPVQVPGTT